MKTGELIEPQDQLEVITTEAKPTLRPFADALKLPAEIETHKLSRAALHGTHRKFGERLKRLEINPATMPDVVIKYGHPDGLKQHRDGSYTITTSRKPKHGHTLNKAALWRNYRHALSRATLDSIEAERPDLFAHLQSQLSASHQESKRLLFNMIAQTQSPAMRLGLSLQLLLFDKVPHSIRGRVSAVDLGQASFDTVNDWRAEAAEILAEVQKSKWGGVTTKFANAVKKHKAAITRRKNELDRMTRAQKLSARLSGKRRKIIREIMLAETKLKAAQNLQARAKVLRQVFPE